MCISGCVKSDYPHEIWHYVMNSASPNFDTVN